MTRSHRPKTIREGLTFDDVLLAPRYSAVHPKDTDVRTRFARGIHLNIPLVSAAMDTVTGAQMAIAMAREGGLGVIHKNLSIQEQASEVDRVKRSESGMIVNPVTLSPRERLAIFPCMAPFILAFGDLNKYVMRDEASTDKHQQLVNKHTYEDDHHWPWYLEDLTALGFDRTAATARLTKLGLRVEAGAETGTLRFRFEGITASTPCSAHQARRASVS